MRKTPVAVFVVFVILSLVIIFSRYSNVSNAFQSFFQTVFSYPRDVVVSLLPERVSQSEIETLRSENKALLSQRYDFEKLSSENERLRNQFRDTGDVSGSLLPVRVLGRIGEYGRPETLIVAASDEVQVGDGVVLGNNLVGIVSSISGRQARIVTVYHSDFELIGRTEGTSASGVVHGRGGLMVFEEVAIQDPVHEGDLVVSSGVLADKDAFVPQNFVIGKVGSVKDQAQAAFQSASLDSLIDFRNLTHVFVYLR